MLCMPLLTMVGIRYYVSKTYLEIYSYEQTLVILNQPILTIY